MSRWDEKDHYEYGLESEADKEESRLLTKFQEYVMLQKTESEKKNPMKRKKAIKKLSIKENKYAIISIIELFILIGFASGFLAMWGFSQ